MILKLLFVTNYFILSKSSVDSYVLFAANIDDFRSIANKIMPGQLVYELADMAANPNMNYRINKQIEHIKDRDDDNDDDDNTSKDYDSKDQNIDGSSYSESQETSKPLTKVEKASKKKFLIKNQLQKVDLDELVKRVQEKLDKNFKTLTNAKAKKNSGVVTTENDKKIEDYYYRDENLNVDFNKYQEYDQQSLRYTVIPEYVNNQSNEEYSHETLEDDVKKAEIIKETVREYAANSIANVKYDENSRAYKNKENVKYVSEYVNENEKKEAQNGIKEAPEYYDDDDNTKGAQVSERNVNKIKDLDASKIPEGEYYEDNANDTQNVPVVENGDIFKEIDMLHANDSYEDYVTPKRDNIFDSGEGITQKTIKPLRNVFKFANDNNKYELNSRPKAIMDPVGKIEKVLTKDEIVSPPTKKVLMKTTRPDEIKAKTGSMWYRDPNIENYDDSSKKVKNNVNVKTTKMFRTMLPTRAHIKISSPNYFAKLPAVAEKYNFNEPIPEKDREPEQIKDIGNPPARINKKVRV